MNSTTRLCLLMLAAVLAGCGTTMNPEVRLYRAAGMGDLEAVKYLVEDGANVHSANNKGMTPLHAAALGGHLEVVKYLVEDGANVNATNSDGGRPLYGAASMGHLEVVKYLVAHGANVHAALHEAALGGHWAVVKYLVAHGANVSCRYQRWRDAPSQGGLQGRFGSSEVSGRAWG